MEKIYEEQQFSPKRKQLNFSIVLSFVIALFAIGSLIAVGFNQISFAAQESFTLNFEDEALVAENGTKRFYVPLMYRMDGTKKVPVFCVQQGVEAENDATYIAGETPSYSNLGVSYILSAYYNTEEAILPSNFSSLTPEVHEYVKRYVTQVAIWLYLNSETSADDPYHGHLTATDISTITGPVIVNVYDRADATDSEEIYQDGAVVLYDDVIEPLITAAKNYTNINTITSAIASTNIDKINNGEIYQTAAISAVADPSDKLVHYYVELEGMDDAYAVDKDGNTITKDTALNPTDVFYIRVPVDKVTDSNKSVKLILSGEFSTGGVTIGEYFACGDAQQIVKLTNVYPRVDNERIINFLASPDTGMTTAQTIYFIGLIVLLCGVGIIYANAKPIEE